ncbi:hypothetical protein HanPSC8_Chr05g0188911 [Helianthus annuus]|nr:hypothetical protein HanPSC8_Chr05g0188911 [Helianthus annuus]
MPLLGTPRSERLQGSTDDYRFVKSSELGRCSLCGFVCSGNKLDLGCGCCF